MNNLWMQGRTLDTAQTRFWTAERRAENDRIEACRVFANFTAEDHGRSRRLVATFATAELAEQAVREHNAHAALVEACNRRLDDLCRIQNEVDAIGEQMPPSDLEEIAQLTAALKLVNGGGHGEADIQA